MKPGVVIIAEAGVNHNGSLELAKKLIDAASEAGADYVKFQTFTADKLVSRTAKKAAYQVKNTSETDNSQYAMLKKLELSESMHIELISYCFQKNISFLSTGFDEDSVDYLDQLGIDLIKIPSGEITNKPFLQHIARKGKPVVMSTGMADMKEIRDAVNVLLKEGLRIDQITVLHCNTEYPTPMDDVNLLAMKTIEKELSVKTGYSDHTLGIEVPIAAVALGAILIEKHFTIDRNLPGPDHKASLEPNELIAMVRAIRNIESAISGNGRKVPSGSELKNRDIARKSLHLSRYVPKGKQLTVQDISVLRPGSGISPMFFDEVIGKISKKDLQEGSLLTWEDLI